MPQKYFTVVLILTTVIKNSFAQIGKQDDFIQILPDRRTIEDVGLKFLDTFLKVGQAELAKNVYNQQMDRLQKGIADKEGLLKGDQVDLAAKASGKVLGVLKENGISIADFINKFQKQEVIAPTEDSKSLVDRLRLELWPEVVARVITGKQRDDENQHQIQNPILHGIDDLQRHHIMTHEQEVLRQTQFPEFESVPFYQYIKNPLPPKFPPNIPHAIPTVSPLPVMPSMRPPTYDISRARPLFYPTSTIRPPHAIPTELPLPYLDYVTTLRPIILPALTSTTTVTPTTLLSDTMSVRTTMPTESYEVPRASPTIYRMPIPIEKLGKPKKYETEHLKRVDVTHVIPKKSFPIFHDEARNQKAPLRSQAERKMLQKLRIHEEFNLYDDDINVPVNNDIEYASYEVKHPSPVDKHSKSKSRFLH